MSEIWKPVVGHAGYEVSNLGRVRSHWRGGCIRKPYANEARGGYRYVCLRGNLQRRIAVLVAAAFVGLRPEGMEVRHWDGDPVNDRADNLVYGTPTENTEDRLRHGRAFAGERHPNARLSAEDVATIRASSASRHELAAQFGVHHGHIYNIRAGRKW